MLFELNDHIHSRFTWSSTKRKIHVQLHLAKENWQIRYDGCGPDAGEVKYFSPDEFSLRIENGVLKKSDGNAWINCRRIEAHSIYSNGEASSYLARSQKLNMDVMDMSLAGSEQISYNPRVATNWRNSNDENIDNQYIDLIVSHGRDLYVPK